MKKIYLFVFSILSIIAMLFFQNCSKTSFNSTNPSDLELKDYSLVTEMPTNGTQLNSFESVKIFVILDFSPSMVDEIEKVKIAINSFIEQTKPKQAFELMVFSIDPNHSVQFREVADNAANTSGTMYADMGNPVASLKVNPNTNQAEFQSLKNTFNQAVASYAAAVIPQLITSNTEVKEAGLCQIVRLLKSSRYVKATDKISFIVMSDEDDSSIGNCEEKRIYTKPQAIRVAADAAFIEIKLNVAGTITKDGGQLEAIDNANKSISMACTKVNPNRFTEPECAVLVSNAACSQAMKQEIMSQPGYVAMNSITRINSCVVNIVRKRSEAFVYFYQDQSTTPLQSILNGSGFTAFHKSYANMADYVDKNYYHTSNYSYSMITSNATTSVAQHAEFLNNQDIAVALNQLITQKVSLNHVTINMVVYDKSDLACPVAAGVSGDRYIGLINSNASNTLFKKESICKSTYDSTLVHTNKLIEWNPVFVYNLGSLNSSQIAKIAIAGNAGILSYVQPDQYKIINNQIEFQTSVVLPQGARIQFYKKSK